MGMVAGAGLAWKMLTLHPPRETPASEGDGVGVHTHGAHPGLGFAWVSQESPLLNYSPNSDLPAVSKSWCCASVGTSTFAVSCE